MPELFSGPFDQSILKRAQEKGLVELQVHNLRDYTTNKQKAVDDYAFGGGAGMVLQIEPIDRCITYLKSQRTYQEVVYTSPDGELLTQSMANRLSLIENIIIICGHYKGVDERVRQYLVTKEISIGNYVLSGGELAAAVISDAVIRLIPGVLNDESSALSDSFQDDLIAPPVYSRPAIYNNWPVPDVLLSGHQQQIEDWRHEQSLLRTKERRPNLLEKAEKGNNI